MLVKNLLERLGITEETELPETVPTRSIYVEDKGKVIKAVTPVCEDFLDLLTVLEAWGFGEGPSKSGTKLGSGLCGMVNSGLDLNTRMLARKEAKDWSPTQLRDYAGQWTFATQQPHASRWVKMTVGEKDKVARENKAAIKTWVESQKD